MHPSRASLAVAIVLVVLAALGCGPSRSLRIVLVGIDGADWSVIDRLAEEGELPGFSQLRRSGRWGVLLTNYSSASPAIWTSIATGKLPHKHAIQDFLARSPRAYHQIPVTRYDRQAAALWNVLSHRDRRVATVAWWASWPAESVNGFVVTQRFFLSSFGVGPIGGEAGIGVGGENPNYQQDASLMTWPEDLSPRLRDGLAARIESSAANTELGRLIAELRSASLEDGRAHDLDVLENIFHTDLLVAASARFLQESEGPFDLLAVYFEGIDVASHLFWKDRFPESWRERASQDDGLPAASPHYAPLIGHYYREIDRILGAILGGAGPDTMVVLASDHGFQTYRNPFDYNYPLNHLLEALGYLERTGDGRIDYARTRWFDHGGNPWKYIRTVQLNLDGVYPLGTVLPAEAPARLAGLDRALRDLRTDAGQRVVRQSAILRDGSGVAVWINERLRRDDSILVDGRRIPVSDIFPPRTLSGNHRPEGIVGFYGGGVRPGKLPTLSSLDLAPTILAALGLPIAEDMDGTPCPAVVQDLGVTVTSVPSYDFLITDPQEADRAASVVDDSLQERLRALGYIQ